MPDEAYFAAPGLSQSGMKDLAVSPLRFWHWNINPKRPKEDPTKYMDFGSALHCAVLEPDKLDERYACDIHEDDYADCLVTMDDLRVWLKDKGHLPKGKLKAELIAQVQSLDANWPILDVLQAQHEKATAGKLVFKRSDWERLGAAAHALRSEPKLAEILSDPDGQAEMATFTTDERTGVELKGKMDWVLPKLTVDIKTFSQKSGKSIDRSIADAIYYEGYYRQAAFYAILRGWPEEYSGEFLIPFVESEPPHEVRLRVLRPKTRGESHLYWDRARIEIRGMIDLYAECVEQFGDRPWRWAQEMTDLSDEELPAGLSY